MVADTSPTWTVLIPTLGQRRGLFERLMSVLLPQLDEFGGAVRVLAWWNNGDPPLPEIRQGLVEAVDTEYLSFVDDDDMVPSYFVAETIHAMQSRPDKVQWQTECYTSGKLRHIGYHSLRYGRWSRDRNKLYRDVTHITPTRTDLAKRADFRLVEPGKPEDQAWVAQIRPHLHTEAVIDKVMYKYLYDRRVSVSRGHRISRGPFEPYQPNSQYFAYHQVTP